MKKLKKKTRNIILIIVGVLVILFAYGSYNFENDKQLLLQLINKTSVGDVKYVLNKMEKTKNLTNPIVNYKYQEFKKKMHARFVSKNEKFENTSKNKIINDISNIYRNYWREELLKENPIDRTDSTLYKNIIIYLISNKLTAIPKDSLSKTIKNDSELKRIIESQGFKADFKLRNGFQELFIWNKQTIKHYTVTLPKQTIKTKVVFIESFHLNGYDDYATFGSSTVGGWAIKDSATLYCNKNGYDLNSEKFKVSYLKHESIHFTDLNDYPNLSSADLEYRAKIIELMYCTEATIYDRISEFVTEANDANRNNSHPYASHILIKNLSKLLFNSKFNTDINQWKKISVRKINNAAKSLYKRSEDKLRKNKNLTEII
jgi:hypothetical protein